MTAERGGCQGCGGPLPPNKRKWCSERCRKTSYAGACVDCGGPTDGSNGRAKAAERCSSCRHAYERSMPMREQRSRLNSGRVQWTHERILNALRAAAGDPRAITVSRYDRWRQAQPPGAAPSLSVIMIRFGGWRAAVTAAGLTPGIRKRAGYRRVSFDEAVASVAACRDELGVLPGQRRYAAWARGRADVLADELPGAAA